MPSWKWTRKPVKHDHEAGSSSGSSGQRMSAAGFAISPPAAPRPHQYVGVATCQRYWDMAMPLPWGDVHLPDGCHLNPERVPVPHVPASGCARLIDINRRRSLLRPDLLRDPRYAVESPLWDTWFRDEHDMRRQSFFAARAHAPAPPRARAPSPSRSRARVVRVREPTPPPPPEADEEMDEAYLKALEDSRLEQFKEWEGLDVQLALSAAGDVAIPEPEEGPVEEEAAMEEDADAEPVWNPALVGQSWTWTSTMSCTPEYISAPAAWVGAETWSPPPKAPHAPPVHLWQPPLVDLTVDGSDGQDGGDDRD